MNKTIVSEENSNLIESIKSKNVCKVEKINSINDCNSFLQQSSTFSDSIYDIYDDTPKKPSNTHISNGIDSRQQDKKVSTKPDSNFVLHFEPKKDRINGNAKQNDNKHYKNTNFHNNKNSYNNYGDDDVNSESTQTRLDEIMRMCADFERHNHPVQSPPFVQNRIKTNGSLPREKKSPFNDFPGSSNHTNVFFPPSPNDFHNRNTTQQPAHNTGYENVKIIRPGQVDITNSSTSPACYENVTQKINLTLATEKIESQLTTNGHSSSSKGYENVFVTRKSPVGYVPQSPRTKIKTCISPKKNISPSLVQRKTEYESMVKSFEEKLRLEIQQTRENRVSDEAGNENVNQHWEMHLNCSTPVQSKQVQQQSVNELNGSMDFHEKIPSISDSKSKNINNLTINIKKNLDEKQIYQLKRQRLDVLQTIRSLKAQISELQRQEDEILRGMDLEKALVTAEVSTEHNFLEDLEKHLAALQTKIHRLEAQRNANRVLQETQQNKLKQSIDVKRNQVEGLEKLIVENSTDELLRSELNQTIELLENDTKTFEDLEFQYLEEETEWLGYRDELYNEQKMLLKQIDEKNEHIKTLEEQGIDNQNIACVDTKGIEKNVLSLLNQLEKSREELKTIDTLLFELSGQDFAQSDSDEEYQSIKQEQNDIMSQSFSGSQEFLTSKQSKHNDLMSKSVNENLFSNKIEMPSFGDGRCYQNIGLRKECVENKTDAGRKSEKSRPKSNIESLENYESSSKCSENADDPLLKLKYNLSPPFERRSSVSDSSSSILNLNLSIESDNFQVNQLETRVPSQDDIDRICKITTEAPMSTQGASLKVIKSIKEIERNRQLLLAQQGSHIIEYERQKMNELRKEIQDEAKNQYLNLQSHTDEKKRRSSDNVENNVKNDEEIKYLQKVSMQSSSYKEPNCTPQRHSHPDLERERPLSKISSEISYDALSNKSYKSSNDIRLSTSYQIQDNGSGSNNSQRDSYASSENKDTGRMVSGSRRNLPKHQRPLTRYLPILSADLNLRLHIESAGHQINLCPNVIIDSYSCRGYLHKLGATFHGWSRRWFVLDRQKMALIYYLDKSERKPRGGAYFSTIDEVYLDHLNTSKSGRPHCTFIVKTKKRSFHLLAASDATARIWIDAIITGAQGNIDY